MTPHERASQLISAWKRGDACGEPGLVMLVTTALEAHTADLRDLLASALAERDALRAELSDETKGRQALERRVEELIVSEARLREALEKCSNHFDTFMDECLTEVELGKLCRAALSTPAEKGGRV